VVSGRRTQECKMFLGKTYQNIKEYTKWPQNIRKGHKIYHMAIGKQLDPRFSSCFVYTFRNLGEISPLWQNFVVQNLWIGKIVSFFNRIWEICTYVLSRKFCSIQ
jgi:hypothetical protein